MALAARHPLFMESPLNKITVKTGAMFKAMTLESSIVLPAPSLTTPEPLVTLVDPTKEQTAKLEMIGSSLNGDAPSLATFPRGLRIAVLTSGTTAQ